MHVSETYVLYDTPPAGHVSVARLLVEKGANPCIPDSSGNLLSSAEHEEIQSILEKTREIRLEK